MSMMRRLLAIGALLGSATTIAGADATLWFGGSVDHVNGLQSTRTAIESNVYDDFDIGPGGALITGLSGDFLFGFGATEAEYEIRSGMSPGNGGTVIASGLVNATDVDDGHWNGQDDFYLVTIGGLNVMLPQGRYWMSLAPLSGSGCYALTTGGADGIGTPLGDGNTFWNLPSAGYNFIPTSDDRALGPGRWDFAYRVNGIAVPEPSACASLIIALIGLRVCTQRRNGSSRLVPIKLTH